MGGVTLRMGGCACINLVGGREGLPRCRATVLVVSTGSREYAIDSRHIWEKGGALTSGGSIEVSALGGSDPAEGS